MNTEQLTQLILTGGIYLFAGYVFVTFVLFVIKEVAPKMMSGRMETKEYISLVVGSLVVLFMLSFGPYYVGTAVLHGWRQFRPLVTEVTTDITRDFYQIAGKREAPVIIRMEDIPPTPIMQAVPQVEPTAPVLLPTPTLAPTATPFDISTWTPDQDVPKP